MHRHSDPTSPQQQMLVTSPRCSLNCNGLSMHLPPLGERSSCGSNYISPPMSASYNQTKFEDQIPQQYSSVQRSFPKNPYHQVSSKHNSNNAAALQLNKALAKSIRSELSTPSSTETSGTSNPPGSATTKGTSEWSDDLPAAAQDAPEGQLVPGPPGIARRAKAHVPSACVNCKKKHLACETKRPCNRCVQNGKEVSSASIT